MFSMARQAGEDDLKGLCEGAAVKRSHEFALLNAFTRSPFGGNPAAIVLLEEPFSDEQGYFYRKIADNFNQPIVVFISRASQADGAQQQPGRAEHDTTNTNAAAEHEPIDGVLEDDSDITTFRIRFFTPATEAPICGHGTIATASWLFSRPELVPPNVRLLRFLGRDDLVITARLLPAQAGKTAPPRIQIRLPADTPVPVDDAKFDHVRKVVAKVWRRDDVPIRFVGIPKEAGTNKGSKGRLLIELENPEDIQVRDLNKAAFVETGDTIRLNIVTVASRNPGVTYESRLFAPRIGLLEDPVCGSANCLAAPYWMDRFGVAAKSEMTVKYVSERGGDLWVAVDTEAKQIELSGEAVLIAEGQIYV